MTVFMLTWHGRALGYLDRAQMTLAQLPLPAPEYLELQKQIDQLKKTFDVERFLERIHPLTMDARLLQIEMPDWYEHYRSRREARLVSASERLPFYPPTATARVWVDMAQHEAELHKQRSQAFQDLLGSWG